MPTTKANGLDIWYDFLGDVKNPLVVLNHGWRGPSDHWQPTVIDGLAAKLRVLIYDVRGHGKTTAPEDPDAYSMPVYAQDLNALLDAIGVDRAHILGSSQGGMIASQFVVDFPQRARSFLLCDSTAGNGADEGAGGEHERKMQQGLEAVEDIARERGLAELAKMRIAYDREHDPHYFEFPEALETREARDTRSYTDMSLGAFTGTARALRNRPDLTARIRTLSTPTLVLVGDWDDFRPCAERDHKLIAGSRFILMRNCAHGAPSWRQEAFVQAVIAFIADVEAGRDVAGEFEL